MATATPPVTPISPWWRLRQKPGQVCFLSLATTLFFQCKLCGFMERHCLPFPSWCSKVLRKNELVFHLSHKTSRGCSPLLKSVLFCKYSATQTPRSKTHHGLSKGLLSPKKTGSPSDMIPRIATRHIGRDCPATSATPAQAGVAGWQKNEAICNKHHFPWFGLRGDSIFSSC